MIEILLVALVPLFLPLVLFIAIRVGERKSSQASKRVL